MLKYSILYISTSALVIILTACTIFLIILVGGMFGLATILPGVKTGDGEAALTVGSGAIALAILSSPLSLFPSYKLSMKLAEKLRERGWEIRYPRRLFALSLGFLILPFLLLLFLGIFFSPI